MHLALETNWKRASKSLVCHFQQTNAFGQQLKNSPIQKTELFQFEINNMVDKKMNIAFAWIIIFYLDFVKSSVEFSDRAVNHRKGREIEDPPRYLVFPQGSNVQVGFIV